MQASGTIANNGFIVLESTGDLTSLSPFFGPFTLSGGGLGIVMLSDNSNNELDITTNVNNYIVGAGTVSLSNNEKKGVIEASGTNPLVINSSDKTLINAGTLKATGTGGLQLDGIIDGSSGGLIMAASGATVTLVGATLIGGTLSSGRINDPGGNATLDGIKATVNNAAGMEIADNASLEIEGKINNTGSITIYFGLILIDGPSVALEGRGTIALDQSNAYQANLVSNAAHATLINVGNTIAGAGLIGDSGPNTMTLINQQKGVIDALSGGGVAGGPLIIDTGANAIVNMGTLEAATGQLYIASNVTNSGNLIANGGYLVAAGVVTGGTATIESTGALEFEIASSATTKFAAGSTGELILDDAGQYSGTVSGFGTNTTQSIDLVGIQFASATKSYMPASPNTSGTLTVKDTSGDIAHIKFSGSYTLAKFDLTDDGNGGTLITDPPIEKKAAPVSNMELFTNYLASFVSPASTGHGVTLAMDVSALANPAPHFSRAACLTGQCQ